jgi:hypothetical protein
MGTQHKSQFDINRPNDPINRTVTNQRVGAVRDTPDHQFLDRSPNIAPIISRWELEKFKNC